MFRIDPHTLYTRADLERALEGTMSLETFLEGLPVRRYFRKAWWGSDLIRALNEVHAARRSPAAGMPSGPIRAQVGWPARRGPALERIPMPEK